MTSSYKKRITPLVSLSILEARKWYRTEAPPTIVEQFKQQVKSAVAEVLANPMGYSVRFADVRRYNLKQFPFAFYYTINEEARAVDFIKFFHIKMNVPYSDGEGPEPILHEP